MINREAPRPARAGVMRRRVRLTSGLLALGLLGACDLGLDVTNPNSPTEQSSLANVDGVIATSLGMQEQLAASVLQYVRAPALVTDEWGTASRALAADQTLFTGLGIDASFGVVSEPFYATYRIARTANAIIERAPQLPGIGEGFAAGLVANAKLFKAMSLGYAAMQYEQLPLDASLAGGVPVPREEAFAEVIRLLESAREDLSDVTDQELAGFRTRALSPGLDLRNTIDAMLARYYLYTDQYQNAIDAAERVNLNIVSEIRYPNPGLNPIHNYSVIAIYVAPLRSFVDEAEPGDKRVGFWVDTLDTPPLGSPPTVLLEPFERYSGRNDPFPVYLPGEMLLIQAEAYARLGELDTAVDFINLVREKVGSAAAPGAALPPVLASDLDTIEEVLAQIAYERRYELFSQGLRWEDLRRLGQYIGREPKADFLPTPQSECITNPNADCPGSTD
jgi:tetratricopeptide (TPR) repeat protein